MIVDTSIAPDDINLDEVPRRFDLPPTQNVHRWIICCSENSIRGCISSVLWAAHLEEGFHRWWFLSRWRCQKKSSWKKLWLKSTRIESWEKECWRSAMPSDWGDFFPTRIKALLILDSMRAHIRFCESIFQDNWIKSSCDSWGRNKVFAATWHQCDRAFKVPLRQWLVARSHIPKLAACQEQLLPKSAILTAWSGVNDSITNGFLKAGLLQETDVTKYCSAVQFWHN